ncbi:hypothetical protein [Roseivivax sp. CAU 1761]
MKHHVENVDVEDVLSSIRRLVSDEIRAQAGTGAAPDPEPPAAPQGAAGAAEIARIPAPGPARAPGLPGRFAPSPAMPRAGGSDRLILTPQQRVGPGDAEREPPRAEAGAERPAADPEARRTPPPAWLTTPRSLGAPHLVVAPPAEPAPDPEPERAAEAPEAPEAAAFEPDAPDAPAPAASEPDSPDAFEPDAPDAAIARLLEAEAAMPEPALAFHHAEDRDELVWHRHPWSLPGGRKPEAWHDAAERGTAAARDDASSKDPRAEPAQPDEADAAPPAPRAAARQDAPEAPSGGADAVDRPAGRAPERAAPPAAPGPGPAAAPAGRRSLEAKIAELEAMIARAEPPSAAGAFRSSRHAPEPELDPTSAGPSATGISDWASDAIATAAALPAIPEEPDGSARDGARDDAGVAAPDPAAAPAPGSELEDEREMAAAALPRLHPFEAPAEDAASAADFADPEEAPEETDPVDVAAAIAGLLRTVRSDDTADAEPWAEQAGTAAEAEPAETAAAMEDAALRDALSAMAPAADAESAGRASADAARRDAEADVAPAAVSHAPDGAAPDAAPRDAEADVAPAAAPHAPDGAAPDATRRDAGPAEAAAADPQAPDSAGAAPLGLAGIDEQTLRGLIAEIVHEELRGPLGARITRNIRTLVQREIQIALTSNDFD